MTTISREIEINASKEIVRKAIAKFKDICHKSPRILKFHVPSKQKEGVGAIRHSDFVMNGAAVDEKTIEWNPGESIKIEAINLKKMPGIKTMVANFSVR